MRPEAAHKARRLMLVVELIAIAAAIGSLALLWLAVLHHPLTCLAFGPCPTVAARAEAAAAGSVVVLAILFAISLATRKLPTYAAAIPLIGILALVTSTTVAYQAVIVATGTTAAP